MSKYRIYELAKEFNTTSKVIIDILERNNMPAKNHMSSVDDTAKAVVDRTFARKSAPVDSSAVKRSVSTAAPKAPEKSVSSVPVAKPAGLGANRSSAPANSGYNRTNNRPNSYNNSGSQTGTNQPSNQNRSSYSRPDQRRTTPTAGTNASQSTSSQYQQRPYSNNNNRPTSNRPDQRSTSSTPGQQHQNRPYNHTAPHSSTSNSSAARTSNFTPSRTTSSTTGGSTQQSRSTSSYNRPQSTNNRPSASNRQQSFSNNRGPSQSNYRGGGNNQSRNASQNRNRPQNQNRHRNNHQQVPQTPRVEIPKPTHVQVGELITVKDFAAKCNRSIGEIIKKLMTLGVMAAINQEIDFDTATLVGTEFGVTVEPLPPEADLTEIPEIVDEPDSLLPRSPVVTVMGHVDHGKTSLLDSIRKANVTASEAGGITQHIGAYQVNYQGKRIVFLDTPGHEAFTAMRARGAQVTDISILVVAADDGVMPQTIEAINHSKSAKVPIIVAINKMDRPGANPDVVKQQLSEHGLIPEDWGGDTIMVPVSAQKKTGITDLLEMVLLVAEMQELKANPNRTAYGTIIEAELDKGRGPVATVLIQKGTLHIGDSIIAGTAHGKVRAMTNERGEKVKKAGPSTPVEVLGLSDVPLAGDILEAVDEKVARLVADKRIAKKRTEDMQHSSKISLDDLFEQIKEGNLKELNIVVKADVQGSIEALKQALVSLKNEEVRVNVIHAAVGAINESDVLLASASNTLIIGFNVRPDANARKAAEAEKVDIRTYRVIYDAINDVQAAITGMLAPTFKESILGRVEVRKVIHIPQGIVAGSYVLEGKISNKSQVRIIRDGIVIHEGVVEGLKRFKDDAKEVAAGYECGVTIEKFRDIKEGDIFEAFIMEEVKKSS
jgi:translation initiation factor IF-2